MELAACVIDSELPADGGALFVAGGLPGGDFGDEGVAVADPTLETLAGQQPEPQFGHVEPTPPDRGVVKLELSARAARFRSGGGLGEGRRSGGGQVFRDDPAGGRARE